MASSMLMERFVDVFMTQSKLKLIKVDFHFCYFDHKIRIIVKFTPKTIKTFSIQRNTDGSM